MLEENEKGKIIHVLNLEAEGLCTWKEGDKFRKSIGTCVGFLLGELHDICYLFGIRSLGNLLAKCLFWGLGVEARGL